MAFSPTKVLEDKFFIKVNNYSIPDYTEVFKFYYKRAVISGK